MADKRQEYMEVVGSLQYGATISRADIAFATNALARFMANPGIDHYKAAKHCLRYLVGTATLKIKYGTADDEIQAVGYSDADWASNPDNRRSTTGWVFELAGGPISWRSKLQPTVALSSCEAEYMAQADAAQEAVHIKSLLAELGFPQDPIPVMVDNQGAKALAENDMVSQRSKHIAVKHHFVRACVKEQQLVLQWIPSEENRADIFTKPLGRVKFDRIREQLMSE